MYVRDLKPGVLIKPNSDREWSLGLITNTDGLAGKGSHELIESGVHHHATARFVRGVRNKRQSIAVYVGLKILGEFYFGVKRQHMLLIDGTLAVMDGYQFGDIEKV